MGKKKKKPLKGVFPPLLSTHDLNISAMSATSPPAGESKSELLSSVYPI
jgi:hypothetical protein